MSSVRMTEGSIPRHLIRYAVPLILGNMFQLTYNAVDSSVVGKYVGMDALASVGVVGPVMTMLILGISGLCVGASIIMSEAFGAGDDRTLRRELSITLSIGGLLSLTLMLLGLALTEPLLRALSVPEELMELTGGYLRVVLLGLPFTCLYNALAQAMKSVGDSRTPLYFLIFSSILNGVLDVLFVAVMHGDAVWSAVATVIAQACSALLCVAYVRRKVPLLCVGRDDFTMDRQLMKRTIAYGGTTALQSACQPIGKLMIQGVIDSAGKQVMAVFNAVSRMDDYACLPAQSISQANSTFIAQNRGAGKLERTRRGWFVTMGLETCWWPVIGLITWFLREPIMSLFLKESEATTATAIADGSAYLGLMAVIYLLPCLTNGCQSWFRGTGRMKLMLLNTFTQISLRVLFVSLFVPTQGLNWVAWASAIGWIAMILLDLPLIFHGMAKQRKQKNITA